MSPEDLAARHPRLYHVTAPDAWPSIASRGLLSAASLVELFELPPERGEELLRARRPSEASLVHPGRGRAVLNDNLPLSNAALERCLDDGLRPADWLDILNRRVFFWATRAGVDRLLGARTNRNRPRLVLEFDSLALARRHGARLSLCPINSGSTIRRPARRGLATFTPLEECSWPEWRRLRGRLDTLLEVTVDGAVEDAASLVVDRWRSDGRAPG